MTIEHFCEASQRIHTMQHQQSERAAGVEQQQLMGMAERHVAGLTGQVSSDSQSPFRPDFFVHALSNVWKGTLGSQYGQFWGWRLALGIPI